MRFWLLFCLFFFQTAIAQELITIEGRVFDSETQDPVQMANVFLANTTLGAATDASGFFAILNVPRGHYDLIVHHIGYELKTNKIILSEGVPEDYFILLMPKILKGETVGVEAEVPKDWHRHLERFTEAFLGETLNAEKVTIENPEVLEFEQKNGFLHARSDSLICVRNMALGYDIRIVLKQFRVKRKKVYYSLYPLFSELTPEDAEQERAWQTMRERVYRGSLKHFLAAMARNQLKEERFETFPAIKFGNALRIRKPIVSKYSNQAYIQPTRYENLKYFEFPGYFVVYNHDAPKEDRKDHQFNFPNCDHLLRSTITLKYHNALIDTLGNVHSSDAFQMAGQWAAHRVTEMLPMDYFPE